MALPYNPPATMEKLLPQIVTSWEELQQYLQSLSQDQLTIPVDAAGWAGKDHVLHMAAWLNGMVALFEGRPRHEGLGIDQNVYESGEIDEINDAIFRATSDLSADEALSALDTTFAKFMEIIRGMSESELQQPYSHFLPNEPGNKEDTSPILHRVYGNTAHHFPEHQTCIKRLIAAE